MKEGDDSHPYNFRNSLILENSERLTELRDRLQSLSWFLRFINGPLARLAYVDLNPIRAGMANCLEESDFTSIQRRLVKDNETENIHAIGNQSPLPFADIKLKEYVALVPWTAEAQKDSTRGLTREVGYSLRSNHTNRDNRFRDHVPQPNRWQRAIGSVDSIKGYAKKHWSMLGKEPGYGLLNPNTYHPKMFSTCLDSNYRIVSNKLPNLAISF